MKPSIRANIITLFSAVLCASVLYAQPGVDIHLSNSFLSLSLPNEIQIEAAAHLGQDTLVVWGTTVEGPNQQSVPALVYYINSRQQLLHSIDARPYSAVAIIPISDRFLVLWNDKRTDARGPGIYGRYVLRDGDFYGDEFLFDQTNVLAGNVEWVSGTTSQLVLWDGAQGGDTFTYARNVNLTDFLFDDPVNLGSGKLSGVRYRMDNDNQIFGRGSAPAIVVTSEAALHPQVIPGGRLDKSIYLESGGGLALLRDTVFEYYSSIFNQDPAWNTLVPKDWKSRRNNPVLVGKDSAGFFLVGYKACIQAGGIQRSVQLAWIYRLRVEPGRAGLQDTIYEYINHTYYASGCRDLDTHLVGCRNTHYISKDIVNDPDGVTSKGGCGFGFSFVLDTAGQVQVWKTNKNYRDSYIETPCSSVSGLSLNVQRIDSDSLSVVMLDSMIYVARVSPTTPSAAHIRPAILADRSDVHLFWNIPEQQLLAHIHYNQFADNIQEVSSYSVRINNHSPSSQMWNGGLWATDTSGASGVVNNFDLISLYYYDRLDLHSATLDGWKTWTLREISGHINEYTAPTTYYKHDIYNPESGNVTALLYNDYRRLHGFITFSADGEFNTGPVWFYNEFPAQAIVPVDNTTVIYVAEDGRGLVVRNHALLDTLSFPDHTRDAVFYRLYDSRLLRIRKTINGDDGLVLDLFGTNGELYNSRTLEEIPAGISPFVLQHAQSKLIALIWGGDEGVHATFLDRDLNDAKDTVSNRQLKDVQISVTTDSVAHPAAVFHNENLIVVWEDFRRGSESDMYGTWWPVPEELRAMNDEHDDDAELPPGSGTERDNQLTIETIRPNPAIEEITVTVESMEERNGTVSLYDSQGQRVIARRVAWKAGRQTLTLDVSGLADGRYELVVQAGNEQATQEVIVL